jgi:dihydroorotate dehydrogenase
MIGSGGIHSAIDAKEKIDAGATLVQIWTGFIYEGPALVKRILRMDEEN